MRLDLRGRRRFRERGVERVHRELLPQRGLRQEMRSTRDVAHAQRRVLRVARRRDARGGVGVGVVQTRRARDGGVERLSSPASERQQRTDGRRRRVGADRLRGSVDGVARDLEPDARARAADEAHLDEFSGARGHEARGLVVRDVRVEAPALVVPHRLQAVPNHAAGFVHELNLPRLGVVDDGVPEVERLGSKRDGAARALRSHRDVHALLARARVAEARARRAARGGGADRRRSVFFALLVRVGHAQVERHLEPEPLDFPGAERPVRLHSLAAADHPARGAHAEHVGERIGDAPLVQHVDAAHVGHVHVPRRNRADAGGLEHERVVFADAQLGEKPARARVERQRVFRRPVERAH